jgi:hypothetical protein
MPCHVRHVRSAIRSRRVNRVSCPRVPCVPVLLCSIRARQAGTVLSLVVPNRDAIHLRLQPRRATNDGHVPVALGSGHPVTAHPVDRARRIRRARVRAIRAHACRAALPRLWLGAGRNRRRRERLGRNARRRHGRWWRGRGRSASIGEAAPRPQAPHRVVGTVAPFDMVQSTRPATAPPLVSGATCRTAAGPMQAKRCSFWMQ